VVVDTGLRSFNTTVDKTNRMLAEIEREYGWSKERRHQSYAALRAVLLTLRDRLTVEEAAHLGAQLPLLVRGIFYDGWDPSRVPMKFSRAEFLRRIRGDFGYDVEGGVERLVRVVLDVLRHHITDGEWEDVRSSLPRDLASTLP
jgi:uncharacterized protein (DUF2267 family)